MQEIRPEKYNVGAAIAAQKKLCESNNYPHFAPANGRCFRCGRNIYEPFEKNQCFTSGITVERASTELITGCPHCHISYCE